MKGEWAETIKPITSKCDLAVMFNAHVRFDAKAAAALAHVLRDMAGKLDREIARQSQQTLRQRAVMFLKLCLQW